MDKAEDIINILKLEPHPEGGYFREIYRSGESIPAEALPERYGGARVFSTLIYYLLKSGDVSALHSVASDETWHFYGGSPVELHLFGSEGYNRIELGAGLEAGMIPVYVIPAGTIFGAAVKEPGSWSLAGCTVAPGFEFDDFSFADPEDLKRKFPERLELINKLAPKEL